MGDAFSEARDDLRFEWQEGILTTKRRILELENDLEETAKLFKRTRSRARRHAINQLRYLLIKEKNLLSNHGKDDWRDF